METLLVLEDDTQLTELMRDILKPYRVIEAVTAEHSLRLFIDRGRRIDLLIAEVGLSKSSGIQVAMVLRSRIPSLPVILTSGYPVSDWSVRDAADLKRLGSKAVTIIEKPFQASTLSKAVRELLGARISRAPSAA